MDDSRTLLDATAAKVLAPFAEPAVQRRIEAGEDLAATWDAIAASGLDQIFAMSDQPWQDACVVLKASGRHTTPAPLAESLMAGALLTAAGIEIPEGISTFGGDALRLEGDAVSGTLTKTAWGSAAQSLVAIAGGRLVLLPVEAATILKDRSISREPRDTLVFERATPLAISAPAFDADLAAYGALMRAAQMAGCIEAVLDMTVQYAQERSQFGKPIGNFQAVQHQLAILAGQSAAATRIVDAAFDRIAAAPGDGALLAFEAAVAKIRTGEAAGLATAIAHQTHGAIGFTDEHRLHYFTRRLWSWRAEFGTEGHWSAVLGRQVAAAGADRFWPAVTAAG